MVLSNSTLVTVLLFAVGASASEKPQYGEKSYWEATYAKSGKDSTHEWFYSAADYVSDKDGGCRCKEHDMEAMGKDTCKPIK